MIAILSPVLSVLAPIIIEDVQTRGNEYNRYRRVQRTATLDGGNVFQDFGQTITDNNIDLTIEQITEAQRDSIVLFWAQSELWMSTPDGFFTIIPVSFEIEQPRGRLTVWIKEQIA